VYDVEMETLKHLVSRTPVESGRAAQNCRYELGLDAPIARAERHDKRCRRAMATTSSCPVAA
jgi:hypothetical protein